MYKLYLRVTKNKKSCFDFKNNYYFLYHFPLKRIYLTLRPMLTNLMSIKSCWGTSSTYTVEGCCTSAYLVGGGGCQYIRTQETFFLQPQKTTELSFIRIQTLQHLFYRTNYKQMRYMN